MAFKIQSEYRGSRGWESDDALIKFHVGANKLIKGEQESGDVKGFRRGERT